MDMVSIIDVYDLQVNYNLLISFVYIFLCLSFEFSFFVSLYVSLF